MRRFYGRVTLEYYERKHYPVKHNKEFYIGLGLPKTVTIRKPGYLNDERNENAEMSVMSC